MVCQESCSAVAINITCLSFWDFLCLLLFLLLFCLFSSQLLNRMHLFILFWFFFLLFFFLFVCAVTSRVLRGVFNYTVISLGVAVLENY